MSPSPLAPQCCGAVMQLLADPDEQPPRGRCYKCCRCHRQHVELHAPPPAWLHSKVLHCIRRRCRRFEVRIWVADRRCGPPPGTDGSGRGRRVVIGRYKTLAEAQQARDRALARISRRVRWKRAA